jgi:predicted RNase H-like nuclease (RuvC/YqgF family)
MIEAIFAISVVVIGVFWFAANLENRVSALEDRLREEQHNREVAMKDDRIDRIEQALAQQGKMLERMAPAK